MLIPIGVALSVVIVILISFSTGVTWVDVTRVGFPTFALAASAALVRLILQGLRFHIYGGNAMPHRRLSPTTSVRVRAGSEFVALATLPYVGDELVRIAWLRQQGLDTGGATWLAYTELFSDVLVSSALALIASGYALASGAVGVAVLVALLVAPVLGLHVFVVAWAGRNRPLRLHWLRITATRLLGPVRAERLVQVISRTLTQFSQGSRTFFAPQNRPALAIGFGLTAGIAVLPAVALWLTFQAYGVQLTLWETVLVSHASGALANLPITLGGSGLGELGANLYTSAVLGFSHWPGVITWRIATFHVPLIATGLALMSLVARRRKREPAIVKLPETTS